MSSQIPFIDAAGIDAVLTMPECISLMHDALRAVSSGGAVQPLRTVIHLPDGTGSLYTMPAFAGSPRSLAVKLVTVFHGNDAKRVPTHQGLVIVFDTETGAPLALIDAARLTALRTAAVSAAATRALAREDATQLAILGAGVQARSHIHAMLAVRPLRYVRIWSRRTERAAALAREFADRIDVSFTAVPAARDAVVGAHIVCTVTAAPTPVLEGRWLGEGTHINAVGASTPQRRELDSDVVARARIFVDSMDGAQHEAGDLLLPWQEGRIAGPDDWTPLGAVLNGTHRGRLSVAEITLFESLGLAVEDAVTASIIAERTLHGDTAVHPAR